MMVYDLPKSGLKRVEEHRSFGDVGMGDISVHRRNDFRNPS